MPISLPYSQLTEQVSVAHMAHHGMDLEISRCGVDKRHSYAIDFMAFRQNNNMKNQGNPLWTDEAFCFFELIRKKG